MQLRAVPEEELAVGSDGKKLPFAIITKDDRRKYVEESGPFGKSRRSRSRSKTSTPGKKEDPSLIGFDKAWEYTKAREAAEEQQQQRQVPSLSRSSSQASVPLLSSSMTTGPTLDNATTAAGSAQLAVASREPMEVLLYGFKAGHQYAAIDQYERIGCGRICEDYSRDPPMEHRRYKMATSHPMPRALTQAEKKKVNAFAGGETWIKVTFESAEAAHRAISASPQTIQGFSVFAELYRGIGPRDDRAIPANATGVRRPSQTLRGASASQTSAAGLTRRSSTLPRGFAAPAPPQSPDPPSSLSSSTASSATATGYTAPAAFSDSVGYPNLNAPTQAPAPSSSGEFCTKIPTARRIKLRPASEALLPTPSFSQKFWASLPFQSIWTGQFIGDQVPRLDDGSFDYHGASLWWKFWYWVEYFRGSGSFGVQDD